MLRRTRLILETLRHYHDDNTNMTFAKRLSLEALSSVSGQPVLEMLLRFHSGDESVDVNTALKDLADSKDNAILEFLIDWSLSERDLERNLRFDVALRSAVIFSNGSISPMDDDLGQTERNQLVKRVLDHQNRVINWWKDGWAPDVSSAERPSPRSRLLPRAITRYMREYYASHELIEAFRLAEHPDVCDLILDFPMRMKKGVFTYELTSLAKSRCYKQKLQLQKLLEHANIKLARAGAQGQVARLSANDFQNVFRRCRTIHRCNLLANHFRLSASVEDMDNFIAAELVHLIETEKKNMADNKPSSPLMLLRSIHDRVKALMNSYIDHFDRH